MRRAAGLTEATVLLKGATTLVASPFQDFYSQSEGTPWLATAGSGDVLAGVIGALLAQLGADVGRFGAHDIDPDARWAAIAAMAASVHGLAGVRASRGGPVTATAIAQCRSGGDAGAVTNGRAQSARANTNPTYK